MKINTSCLVKRIDFGHLEVYINGGMRLEKN